MKKITTILKNAFVLVFGGLMTILTLGFMAFFIRKKKKKANKKNK